MNEQSKGQGLAIAQPWRGIFGLAVTVGYTLTITAIFDMEAFNGVFSLLLMCFVPILVMTGMGWRGAYPSTEGLQQPWRGILLTAFVVLFGVLVSYVLRNFLSGGVTQPFIIMYTIATVITTFILILAFGLWPFERLSLGARGWLSLILAYVVAWFVLKLFNFSMLSFPTGVNPSPIDAVPFYAKGGPLAAFAAMAPKGPFRWECAVAFYIWMVTFVIVFAGGLGMWPFNKSKALMRQPVLGIVVVIVCGVLSAIAYAIGIVFMKIEPLRFLLCAIIFLYGFLMLMILFHTWPGRNLKHPVAGGFVNILIGIGIGIIGYYAYKLFAVWHFGAEAMTYPNNIFSIANMMLGLTFPAWACYSDLWDFWPLPPTPVPPQGNQG